MKNVCVVGAGGIGSYFCEHIDKLIELNQINNLSFTFYDFDIIEPKNILYQNFDEEYTDMYKTEALELKYFNISFKNEKVNLEILSQYNLIILCADNNIIRKETFENFKKNNIPFIDSRANGKCIGLFSSDTENYLDTITNDDNSTSCQNPFQLNNKIIEYGNVMIASILAQTVLNLDRTNKLPYDLILNV